MKAKTLLIVASLVIVCIGAVSVFAGIDVSSYKTTFPGVMLLIVGIVGIIASFFHQRRAGAFFIEMGLLIWLPIGIIIFDTADSGGNTLLVLLAMGIPCLAASAVYCLVGYMNYKV